MHTRDPVPPQGGRVSLRSPEGGTIPNDLPPILRGDLRLDSIGQSEHGYPFVRFISEDDDDTVRSVVVYLTTSKPTKLLYGYSVWDPETRSLTSYHGEYGDPLRDSVGDIDAI